HPYPPRKGVASATVSRLSAPRSSMKLAPSVTFDSSTPRCSTTIFFTRVAISLMVPRPHPQIAEFGPSLSMGIGRWPAPRRQRESASYHGHAAIHMQGLAGHVGGLVAGQEDHGGRHVGRGPPPPGGGGAQHPPALFAVQ